MNKFKSFPFYFLNVKFSKFLYKNGSRNLSIIMGQTLSEPITAKETAFVKNDLYEVASSAMQGWRIKMEDAHTHILSLPDDPGTAFFGVYDGHGGAKTAQYAGRNLHKFIINRPEYKEGNITEALKQAFLELDNAMIGDEYLKGEHSGSTAVTVIIKDNILYCANIGDSRAIASVNNKLEKLSWDHKPNNIEESKRIAEAGGWVDCNRVNGNLALSRAFGDYVFKANSFKGDEKQIVIAVPDIVERKITQDWDFLILACDGIWDVMSDEDVMYYVTENIANGLESELICENLMMKCLAPDCHLAGLGCDNMTVVLVVFLHGDSYDKVIEKCKNYVAEHKIGHETDDSEEPRDSEDEDEDKILVFSDAQSKEEEPHSPPPPPSPKPAAAGCSAKRCAANQNQPNKSEGEEQ
ncbi:probable protein phosphatase 2C T23F11.1 isoform X2 [Sitophilus oryzae]|uniref:protein-serine/threonine phosphatase n=1 Tax=Sitophilus oryzae TaxID=7048 RepID=A0A6J2YJS0_SITOR|nr:probable protein phosphatase 2C T23F11.1 isoform X2 [Sitophilus oryzae]